MNEAIGWIKENLALIVAMASVVGAIGATYPLLKDFIPWLLRTLWDVVRAVFAFVWWIMAPLRWALGRLIELLLDKFVPEKEKTP